MAISTIPFVFPGLPSVGCCFTTRQGGQSTGPFASANLSQDVGDNPGHIEANRRGLMHDLNLDHWLELEQVHGTEVIVEPEVRVETIPLHRKGDGLASSQPSTALVVKTADCQPILLSHCSGRFIAALHCGWRGNRAGFPILGVQSFCNAYHITPDEVLVVRGPSLSPAKSEFVNFQAEFGSRFKAYFDPAMQTVDLWSLTRDQLLQAGLRPQNIFSLDLCTASLPDHFFSYRREGLCGRQAGVVWIKA